MDDRRLSQLQLLERDLNNLYLTKKAKNIFFNINQQPFEECGSCRGVAWQLSRRAAAFVTAWRDNCHAMTEGGSFEDDKVLIGCSSSKRAEDFFILLV